MEDFKMLTLQKMTSGKFLPGEWNETVFIVTSDHGEAMFQHGTWGHNYTLFDEMVQVPLLVRFPGPADDGRPRGQVRDELASIMDVTPSICQWLDLAPPADLDGRSLAGLLAGTESSSSFDERFLHLRSHSSPPWLGLRRSDQKVIWIRGKDKATGEDHPERTAFYDLVADPDENRDLGATDDPRVAAGQALLEAEIQALRAAFQGAESASFSDEEAAMMGALGYTDED